MRMGLATAALWVLAACGDGDGAAASVAEDGAAGGSGAGVRVSTDANDSTALADADVKITSTDGRITLAVVHDSVVMQMSDSLRQSVSSMMDSSTGPETVDGMGGAIAKVVGSAVKAAVTSAMGIAVRSPASQVTDLRYENGRLFLKIDGGSVKVSREGRSSGDGMPFAEADARAFIDAVERAKVRGTAM